MTTVHAEISLLLSGRELEKILKQSTSKDVPGVGLSQLNSLSGCINGSGFRALMRFYVLRERLRF